MESEQERRSHRFNQVEQKRLEKNLKLLTKSQRSVALDIQKSQREMKRRLQKYRERQRDLMGETDDGPVLTMEDIMRKHQPRLASQQPLPRGSRAARARPATAPPIKVDMPMFLDIQKSKLDLRPMTTSASRQKILHVMESRQNTAASGYRPVTGERIGPTDLEARYFVDEELDERKSFYHDLIEWRKRNERIYFKEVSGRVMEFCGIQQREEKPASKAKWRSVSLVLKFKNLGTSSSPEGMSFPLAKATKAREMGSRSTGPREAWTDSDGKASSKDDSSETRSSSQQSN